MIRLRMTASDFGYGEDGNTLEREPQHLEDNLCFLFVRKSNSTKVFLTKPDSYILEDRELIWSLESDHDSCWKTDGLNEVTDTYFSLCKPLCNLLNCAPKDVYTLNMLDCDPKYMEIEEMEKFHKKAALYSPEYRLWRIKIKGIGFDRLIQKTYEGTNAYGDNQVCKTGLLIKDDETNSEGL